VVAVVAVAVTFMATAVAPAGTSGSVRVWLSAPDMRSKASARVGGTVSSVPEPATVDVVK
jgi:hypothetical protein